MDLLQVALIFLILLLSVFLAITGFQVFIILRNLKKALDRLNSVLKTGENIVSEIEKPVEATANLVTSLSGGAKAVTKASTPKQKRFYRKVL